MPARTLTLAVLFASASGLAGRSDDPLPTADPAITRAELEHHVRFLASDELAGRGALTSGADRAAQYIARALAAAKVEPAGDEGGFFQATPARRYEYPSLPRLLFTDEAGAVVEARYGADFTLVVRGTARSTEKLSLRFFYDYNHARMPPTGRPEEAIHFSASKEDRRRILESKGIRDLGDWGLEIDMMKTDKGFVAGKPADVFPPRLVVEAEPEQCELVTLRGPMRIDFEKRKYTHVQLLVEEKASSVVDRNVIGRVRGVGTAEHPELAAETVVLAANYDHLGTRPPRPGQEAKDSIYNGADDNASGCALLLELAQALAAAGKPARSVVFLFATGGENERSGVQRYLAAPAAPFDSTVCVLNFESVGLPNLRAGGEGRLWLAGYDRSTLAPSWQERGFVVESEEHAPRGAFSRTDGYPFALQGVVAHTLSSAADREEVRTPHDEADTLDYAHLEGAGRFAMRGIEILVAGAFRPEWLEGMRPKGMQTSVAPETPEEIAARRRANREANPKLKRKRPAEEDDGDEGSGDGEDEGGDDEGDDGDGGEQPR